MSNKIARESNPDNLRNLRLLMGGMVGVSLLIACVPFILPETPGSQTEDFLSLAVVTLVLSSFATVAAILFILGMRGFTNEFKKTYYYLCTGLAIQAVALILYPAALYFGILGNQALDVVGNVLYLVGTIIIFLGVRHFARLLELKTWLTNGAYVGIATIALAGLLWLVPHTPTATPELIFDLTQSTNSTEGILSIFCALLVIAIRKHASLFYAKPLQWLSIALIFNGVSEALYFAAHHVLSAEGVPNADITAVSALVMITSRIFYLVAGYSLIRTTHAKEVRQLNSSPVDVIVYMAGLASKTADIDPMLDKLRVITVTLSPGEKLSSQQAHSLEVLYQQLRDYLLKRESLLVLTSESLDRRLQHKFGTIPFPHHGSTRA